MPDQAEGPLPVAGAAGGRAARGVRHHAGDPAAACGRSRSSRSATTPPSIANAARRFLAEQDRMEELCGRIFAGHLRSIVGSLTVEEIIRERDKVAQEVKDGSHTEMEKLGIVVDGLQIQEIEDPTGYITQPGRPPRRRRGQSAARIAAAERDQEAAEKEQQAAAGQGPVRSARRRSSRPRSRPRCKRPQARAAQAGPLAEAKALAGRDRASRRRWPSARPPSPTSGSSPRCAGRPTPRPTSSAPWPRPPATRPSTTHAAQESDAG